MMSGDIYSYNLDTKELKLLLEANAKSLYIDSTGIFYQNIPNTSTMAFEGWRLDFGSGTPYKADYAWYFSGNGYTVYNTENDIVLCNNATGEIISVAPVNILTSNINVCGNYFMFIQGSCIYILNLLTGEKKVFDIKDFKYKLSDDSYIFDYIMMDNCIYVSVMSDIYMLDINSGEMILLRSQSASAKMNELLFTDGSKIFALTKALVTNGYQQKHPITDSSIPEP